MNEKKLSVQLLSDYVSKTLTDQKHIDFIDQARTVTGSWVQRTVDEIYEKLADPLNVDWGGVHVEHANPLKIQILPPAELATPQVEQQLSQSPEDRLRHARLAQGLSVEELAQAVQIHRPGSRLDAALIQAIEAGQERLDNMSASFLAAPLKVRKSELLPMSENVQPSIMLKEETPSTEQKIAAGDPEQAGNADIEQELRDFLPPAVVQDMIRAWREGSLPQWVSQYLRTADDYQDALVLALAAMSLTKDHLAAATHLEQLVLQAGDQPQRLQDAYYLRGRGHWYLKNYAAAAMDLQQVLELHQRTLNKVRLTQAEYYLARLSIVAPNSVAETTEQLMARVEAGVREIDRPDLELLAKREQMIRYHSKQQSDRAIELGKKLLAPQSAWVNRGFDNILDSVVTYLGVCLRGLYTEPARQEAEQLYWQGINRGRDDSHAGMCLYLLADLYVDRRAAALQQAAEVRHEPATVAGAMKLAEEYNKQALTFCEQAHRILSKRGDKEALEKANRRLVFLESSDSLPAANDQQVVAEYAVRRQRFTELFLGAPKRGSKGSYSPKINDLNRADLEELLRDYFSGLLVKPGQTIHNEISLDSFLRPDTLLCLPWIVGSSLVIRVFGYFADQQKADSWKIVNIGWFVLRHYTSDIRPCLAELLESELEEFLGTRKQFFDDLQKQVQTIDPMSRHEHPGLRQVRDIIILAPQSNQEWLCPVEWFKTGPYKREPGLALLDYAAGSLVFTSTVSGPFEAMQQRVAPADWRIVATTQAADEQTIYEHATKSLGAGVELWNVSEPLPTGSCQGIMVLAHADAAGSVERALAAANLGSATCAALLFCSSGQYSLNSGPFVDGIARTVHSRLSSGGLVIGARVPVSLPEALRMAKELRQSGLDSRPLSEVVTSYINAGRQEGKGNPYEIPWVILT